MARDDTEIRGHTPIHCHACDYSGMSDDSGGCPNDDCPSNQAYETEGWEEHIEIECSCGHAYDSEEHDACPHCSEENPYAS